MKRIWIIICAMAVALAMLGYAGSEAEAKTKKKKKYHLGYTIEQFEKTHNDAYDPDLSFEPLDDKRYYASDWVLKEGQEMSEYVEVNALTFKNKKVRAVSVSYYQNEQATQKDFLVFMQSLVRITTAATPKFTKTDYETLYAKIDLMNPPGTEEDSRTITYKKRKFVFYYSEKNKRITLLISHKKSKLPS